MGRSKTLCLTLCLCQSCSVFVPFAPQYRLQSQRASQTAPDITTPWVYAPEGASASPRLCIASPLMLLNALNVNVNLRRSSTESSVSEGKEVLNGQTSNINRKRIMMSQTLKINRVCGSFLWCDRVK